MAAADRAEAVARSRAELSLLLFLETQAVDHGGLVNTLSMNDDDWEIAARWKATGYVEYGRIASDDLQRFRPTRAERRTHWVRLSDRAFTEAHAERRARAVRMWERRSWQTTAETRA